MLNKTDVSNEITGLRPKIKQAAVHIAHHLTREVKKCEKRKGDNAKKFHNRAETLRKEVLLLKEIKPDAVSRFALLMDFKEREKLLNDVNFPLKDKVMVRIATHKAVCSHVEAFRKTHPEWSSKLPQLLSTLGIRAKFKKKVQKEQEKQKRKLARRQAASGDLAMNFSVESMDEDDKNLNVSGKVPLKKSSNDGKILSQHLENDGLSGKQHQNLKTGNGRSKVGSESSSDEEAGNGNGSEDGNEDGSKDGRKDGSEYGSEGGTASEDEVESEEASQGEGDSGESGESSEDDDGSEVDVRLSDEDDFESHKGKTKVAQKKTVLKPSTTSMYAEVRRFADLQKEGNQVKESVLSEKHNLSESDLSEAEPVEEDPFFVTQENSFLKTVAVKRENGEGLQSSSKSSGENSDRTRTQWSLDGQKLKGNRAERRAKFLGRDMKKRRPKEFNRDGPNNKNGGDRTGKGNHRFGNTKFSHNSERTGDWKANKNHRVAHFEKDSSFGKRSEKTALKSHEKFSMKDKISGKQNPKLPDSGESLHPSWEAKRKQKVSLDDFQGKKIKFDD